MNVKTTKQTIKEDLSKEEYATIFFQELDKLPDSRLKLRF